MPIHGLISVLSSHAFCVALGLAAVVGCDAKKAVESMPYPPVFHARILNDGKEVVYSNKKGDVVVKNLRTGSQRSHHFPSEIILALHYFPASEEYAVISSAGFDFTCVMHFLEAGNLSQASPAIAFPKHSYPLILDKRWVVVRSSEEFDPHAPANVPPKDDEFQFWEHAGDRYVPGPVLADLEKEISVSTMTSLGPGLVAYAGRKRIEGSPGVPEYMVKILDLARQTVVCGQSVPALRRGTEALSLVVSNDASHLAVVGSSCATLFKRHGEGLSEQGVVDLKREFRGEACALANSGRFLAIAWSTVECYDFAGNQCVFEHALESERLRSWQKKTQGLDVNPFSMANLYGTYCVQDVRFVDEDKKLATILATGRMDVWNTADWSHVRSDNIATK